MAAPRLAIVGDEAVDFIGHAFGLYRKFEASGKKSQTIFIKPCLILLEKGKIKIIAMIPKYAIFVFDFTTLAFDYVFPTEVPAAWPKRSGRLPSLPTFYPAYPGELIEPLYNRFDSVAVGASAPHQTVLFQNPILSSFSESLQWHGLMFQPNKASGNNWFLTRYALTGHLNRYVNPDRSKVVLSKGVTNLAEADFSAMNVFPVAGFTREGIAYRRLKSGNKSRIVLCQQDDTLHSGQIFEVVETDDGLSTIPFGLPDLPNGSRLPAGIGPGFVDTGTFGRHVDWVYDIFTSERSQFYYVVKFKCDSAVTWYIYSGNPYPDDVQMFSGMSLAVEQRKKTDLSLVQTFNVTPSAVDWTLQGASYPQVFFNMVNGQGGGFTTGTDIITRFIPYGSGSVLVAEDGTEYPILPVLQCTQDWLWDTVYAAAGRENYTNGTGMSSSLVRNVFVQTALLWLGTPPEDFDGWTWTGVDAIGLKINESQPGAINDLPLGIMRTWGSIISDSNRLMAQMLPFDTNMAYFSPISVVPPAMTIECRYFYSGFAEGDKVYIETDEGVFVYTVTSEDLSTGGVGIQENIVANVISGFNSWSKLYSATYDLHGFDMVGYLTRFTVARISDGEMQIKPTFTIFGAGQSNRQNIISVRLNPLPTVKLETTLPTTQSAYMFDI